jgi:membrane protease YdiL (CAAX protease family)
MPLGLALLFAVLAFGMSIFYAAIFLGKTAAQLEDRKSSPEADGQGEARVTVVPEAYKEMLEAERALKDLVTPEARQGILDRLESSLRWPHMHRFRLDKEERDARAREIVEVFKEKGSGAFQPRKDPEYAVFKGDLWPAPPQRPAMVRAVSLFLLLFILSQFFISLGMANQDLGAVSWSLEWLFTLPATGRALFRAKTCEYALVNALGWFGTLPFLLTVYFAAGLGNWSIPAALLATAASVAMLGALRLLTETWIRKSFAAARVKNLQALFTIAGMLLLSGIFVVAFTPTIPAPFLGAAERLPGAVLWNPLSLPALLADEGTARPLAAAILILMAFAVSLGGTRLAGFLVRDGLITSGGREGGRRAGARPIRLPSPRERGLRWIPAGIVGKELRIVLRDRNRMVQTLVLPLFFVGLQLIVNPALLAGAAGDFQHAAALAFFVGAYLLFASAFQVLLLEGGALWILYTLPHDLHTVFLKKTILWSALASFYAALILFAAALSGVPMGLHQVVTPFVAIAGVALQAFVAAGLGILATDPLAAETPPRPKPMVVYLYYFIAGLFANAIYAPSLWTKAAQLVLLGALVAALWQKVRDHVPYLLDPTEKPPPRVALADGLIAALAFFALQSVFALLFIQSGAPAGASLFSAFAAAGLIVCLYSLFAFWGRNVMDLPQTVGWELGPGGFLRALWNGLAGGAIAVGIGFAYLVVVERFAPLRRLKEETLGFKEHLGADGVFWVSALAILAAPFFEEYIFRGLIYRGLRRSAGVVPAVLLSAALFAVVHPPISVIPVFCLGILCALAMERAGNLLAPVLVHALYNTVMVAAN